ncbi:hypothetical protein CPB86DRAFT_802481, partial [Serendipita vermifera]
SFPSLISGECNLQKNGGRIWDKDNLREQIQDADEKEHEANRNRLVVYVESKPLFSEVPPAPVQMDRGSNTLNLEENTIDDTSHIPDLDDLFWEYMHARKRYALNPEEYEKEWSAWLRIYLFGDSDAVNKSSKPCPIGGSSLLLGSVSSQPANIEPHSRSLALQFKSRDTCHCSICFKEYPRVAGAQGCKNRHLQIKPYVCTKKCGNENWDEAAREPLQRSRNGTDMTARQS